MKDMCGSRLPSRIAAPLTDGNAKAPFAAAQ